MVLLVDVDVGVEVDVDDVVGRNVVVVVLVDVDVVVDVDVGDVDGSNVGVGGSFLHCPDRSLPAGLRQLCPGGFGSPELAGEITAIPRAATAKTKPTRPNVRTIPIASRCLSDSRPARQAWTVPSRFHCSVPEITKEGLPRKTSGVTTATDGPTALAPGWLPEGPLNLAQEPSPAAQEPA